MVKAPFEISGVWHFYQGFQARDITAVQASCSSLSPSTLLDSPHQVLLPADGIPAFYSPICCNPQNNKPRWIVVESPLNESSRFLHGRHRDLIVVHDLWDVKNAKPRALCWQNGRRRYRDIRMLGSVVGVMISRNLPPYRLLVFLLPRTPSKALYGDDRMW